MSAIDNTPSNKNFLSPLNFKFQIKKAPHVNFFIQKVNVPSIDLPSPNVSNPMVKIPYPGEHINYGKLDITFKIDEDFENYLEIHNWITALGKPEEFSQYKEIQDKPDYTGEGIYSDISLIILASTKTPNFEITYIDAHPISLSQINFNTTDETVNYISASAIFNYTYFKISKI
ncbi:tail completion and sheath stabilizer protein [uncultured Caudovirales phage]|uniref:Tail completion and sheath stabilizer protein n=1 Tax=uncultured Caudovirales phage TaxID=2100421 RepID=A0A6J5P5S7_9CAUD|nr:tail completion and sheath stabilizer protein [uncultured Caudovirales phage]